MQIVHQLARQYKQLYVVQRTPASVDVRDQQETDEEWFDNEVARSKGWHRERMRNFHQHFTLGGITAANLVNDGWTRAPCLVGITGYPGGFKLPKEIPAYTAKLVKVDTPRQNRVHARVNQEVRDPDTTEKLKPWNPVWCKRPLFHDDYLQTFNQDNVTLVDTNGKGIDQMMADSLMINDIAYQTNIAVFATGLNGVFMSKEWPRVDPTTLHGAIDANFPNLFLSGPQQTSISGNYRFNLDECAKHISYILTEEKRRANGVHFTVAPSVEAAEDWGMQVMMHSAPMGVTVRSTPGYFNLEGDLGRAPPEQQMGLEKSDLWSSGIEHWFGIIVNWRAGGDMKGIVVS